MVNSGDDGRQIDDLAIEMGADWNPESRFCCGKPSANHGPFHDAPALTAPTLHSLRFVYDIGYPHQCR